MKTSIIGIVVLLALCIAACQTSAPRTEMEQIRAMVPEGCPIPLLVGAPMTEAALREYLAGCATHTPETPCALVLMRVAHGAVFATRVICGEPGDDPMDVIRQQEGRPVGGGEYR